MSTPCSTPQSSSSAHHRGLADANAHGHRPRHPSFLHTSVANIRLRPHRPYTPQRRCRGLRIGSTITLAAPSVFVQIPSISTAPAEASVRPRGFLPGACPPSALNPRRVRHAHL